MSTSREHEHVYQAGQSPGRDGGQTRPGSRQAAHIYMYGGGARRLSRQARKRDRGTRRGIEISASTGAAVNVIIDISPAIELNY